MVVAMLQFLATGFFWFTSSAFLSTYANSTYLKTFQDPALHTFIRFAGSAMLSLIALVGTGEVAASKVLSIVKDMAIPAVFLFIANFANSIALEKAGITLTYIVKACIPVFTVIICRCMGEKYSTQIYLSLLPICFGVALACAGDLDFNALGLLGAILSAISQTLMNIIVKSVQKEKEYSGIVSFLGMTIVCTTLSFGLLLLQSIHSSSSSFVTLQTALQQFTVGEAWPLSLTLLAAFAYYVEYALNFVFCGYVSNVSFSVSDIARRICIICIGAIMFHKTLTMLNMVGIAVAISGVLWYTYLNDRETRSKASATRKEK